MRLAIVVSSHSNHSHGVTTAFENPGTVVNYSDHSPSTVKIALQEEHLLRLVLLDQQSPAAPQDASSTAAAAKQQPTGAYQGASADERVDCKEKDDLRQRLQLHELLAEQHQQQMENQIAEADTLRDSLKAQQQLVKDLQQQVHSTAVTRTHTAQHDQQQSRQDMQSAATKKLQTSLQEQQELIAALQQQLSSRDDNAKQLQQKLSISNDNNKQLQQQLSVLHQEGAESRQRCKLQEVLVQQLYEQLQEMTDMCHQLQQENRVPNPEPPALQQCVGIQVDCKRHHYISHNMNVFLESLVVLLSSDT